MKETQGRLRGIGDQILAQGSPPLQTEFCSVPSTRSRISSTLITNSSVIPEWVVRLAQQFSAMNRRKAFRHWYTGEGMADEEFDEAQSRIESLIAELQEHGGLDPMADDSDEEYEEELVEPNPQ